MTIKEIIDYADQLKPNAFSAAQKTMWLNEVEGMVESDIFLLDLSTPVTYVYGASWSGTGVYFPDHKTMVLPDAPGVCAEGLLTMSGLVDYPKNNIVSQRVLSVSGDGKTLTFAENTFLDTGETGETAKIALVFNGSGKKMLAPAAYQKIYYTYLLAMIDFTNEEYGKYQNTMALFNSFFGAFMRWYALNYRPADGNAAEAFAAFQLRQESH